MKECGGKEGISAILFITWGKGGKRKWVFYVVWYVVAGFDLMFGLGGVEAN